MRFLPLIMFSDFIQVLNSTRKFPTTYYYFLIIYNGDRLGDTRTASTTPNRSVIIDKYTTIAKRTILLGLLMIAWLSWYSGWLVAIPVLMLMIMGGLYSLPILPFNKIRRIKDIPCFKNFVIPLVACLNCVIGLLLMNYEWWHPGFWLLVVYIYIRAFVSAFLGDYRDMEEDRKAGIITFSRVLGIQNSKRAVWTLNVLTISYIIILVWNSAIPLRFIGLIMPGVFAIVAGQMLLSRTEKMELWGEWYDLEFLLMFPSVWVMGKVFTLK